MGIERGCFHENDLESMAERPVEDSSQDGLRLFLPPTSLDGTGFCLVTTPLLLLAGLGNYGKHGINFEDTYNSCRHDLKLPTFMVTDGAGKGVHTWSAQAWLEKRSKIVEVVINLDPNFRPE
ncbi:unnamed protein product [Haemonchus placei]|uniref:Abhydrolase_3 domain-containing protein n=1 Tax=Haemonchus placei TaxID=6290 RepID=A0A0N4WN71_HAEPC|nr:unnamed protein product [Haemonchus placei]